MELWTGSERKKKVWLHFKKTRLTSGNRNSHSYEEDTFLFMISRYLGLHGWNDSISNSFSTKFLSELMIVIKCSYLEHLTAIVLEYWNKKSNSVIQMINCWSTFGTCYTTSAKDLNLLKTHSHFLKTTLTSLNFSRKHHIK